MKARLPLVGVGFALLALVFLAGSADAGPVAHAEVPGGEPLPVAPALPCSYVLTPSQEKPTGIVYTDGHDVSFVWTSPPGTWYCGNGASGAWIDNVWYDSWLTSPSPGVYNYYIKNKVYGLSHGTHTVRFQWAEQSHSWTFTQIRCGTNQLADATKTNTPALVEVVFTGGSPDCAALSWGMKVDGKAVTPTLSKSGTTYTLRYEPTPKLGGGTHTVEAWVEEQCCRPDGTKNRDTATWTFTIPYCGSNPLQVSSYGPTSSPDSRPVITARMRDVDVVCNLDASSMLLDGWDIGVTPQRVGNEWVFTYFPTYNLAYGVHTVEVYVREACCNGVGEGNEGRHTWTFTVGLPGEDEDETIPGTGAEAGYHGQTVYVPCTDPSQGPACPLRVPSIYTNFAVDGVRYSWNFWGIQGADLETRLTLRLDVDGTPWLNQTIPIMV